MKFTVLETIHEQFDIDVPDELAGNADAIAGYIEHARRHGDHKRLTNGPERVDWWQIEPEKVWPC